MLVQSTLFSFICMLVCDCYIFVKSFQFLENLTYIILVKDCESLFMAAK